MEARQKAKVLPGTTTLSLKEQCSVSLTGLEDILLPQPIPNSYLCPCLPKMQAKIRKIMTLEQLNTHLENTLTEANITSLNPLQQAIVSRVKQGGDAVFIAGKQRGKSTGIALASVIKAPKAFEGSPRVLILSPTIDSVHTLHKALSDWIRRTEIAAEIAHDKGNMVLERNNIFEGADIIVGNPKRILDLYIQNGIHVGQLNRFVIEDASDMVKDAMAVSRIMRLVESLPKCQKFILTSELNPRTEKLIEDICIDPKVEEFETDENDSDGN